MIDELSVEEQTILNSLRFSQLVDLNWMHESKCRYYQFLTGDLKDLREWGMIHAIKRVDGVYLCRLTDKGKKLYELWMKLKEVGIVMLTEEEKELYNELIKRWGIVQ